MANDVASSMGFGTRGRPSADQLDNRNAMVELIAAGAATLAQERIKAESAKLIDDFSAWVEDALSRAAEAEARMKFASPTIVLRDGKPPITLPGKQHMSFERLLKVATAKLPVMLVGPAGTGKTTAASQVAEALELPFYAVSVGMQTSKSDLLGYYDATGNYVASTFREAYEMGGVFLMDEVDAGNSNVLIVLNSALANGECGFPDGMVDRHEDFVFIGTANTYGTGATREYVGRNQLDAATIDRFVMLAWDIDPDVEAAMAGTDDIGKRWLKVVRAVRSKCEAEGYRVIVSPRAVTKGVALLRSEFAFDEVVKAVLCATATPDQSRVIADVATKAWS